MDFLARLFDTSDFPARWRCGSWTALEGWLHILSDLGIWLAYLAIPCILLYFLRSRKDLPFRKILLLFGAFILLCGTTHLMEAIIFWWPAYRLAGAIKLLTALISWATVIALVPIVAKVLSMRTPEELTREIEERTKELNWAVAHLREERELLRTTLGSIGDGVIATDTEGRVTFLNPVAESLTGWKSADALKIPLERVFHIVNEQNRQPVENPALRALREGIIVGLANHTILIAPDGTERPIDDSAAPIRDGSGSVSGSVLVFRDITERKREEVALAERARLIALRADISTALASTQLTATGLQQCCEALVRHLNAAFARIWTLDDANKVLELQASAGIYTHLNGPHSRVPVGQFKIGRIASTHRPHLTNAVADDPNVSDREWAAREGMVAFAGYPLEVEGRVVGVVALFARHSLTEGVLTELAPLGEAIAQYIYRRRAEEALRESEVRKAAVVNSALDGIITIDHKGKMVEFNPAAERTFGYHRDAVLGREMADLIIPPPLREGHRRGLARYLATGEGPLLGKRLELTAMRSDGTEFPVEVTITRINSDDPPLFTGYIRDITERTQAERALRASEQRLRFVMDSMPQKIFTARQSGDIDYFNPQWMDFTGLSFEQIRDWGWTQFVHADDVAENVRLWKHSIDNGEPFQFEQRFRRADGEYRWHISRAKALRDAEGKIVMWVGSNTDIHEQRQTANELRDVAAKLSEADRRKDEFIAMLAHELRNPLAPLRNGLHVMELSKNNGEVVDQARTMMERQLKQMIRLVDDLLDVSRISSGKIQLRKERVELSVVLNTAIETSRPLIDSNGHELTVALPPLPIFVDADATRLGQVFANLLNNAAKYSERGGRIELTVESQGSQVVVSVKDSGVGIPPEMLPQIFDLFTQVDRSLERSQGGLGIGLTLAKRLVEKHGGSVEARSEGHGKGCEFIVRLPVASSVVPEVEPPASVEPVGSSPRRRIMVADDNVDSATSLALLLQYMGNEVRTANDGLEAVELATKFQPDVILLDIGMPKLNGYEACRRIRQQSWGKNAVLIALTGWGQDEDRRQSQEAGFTFHMVKPVDPTDLQKLMAGM